MAFLDSINFNGKSIRDFLTEIIEVRGRGKPRIRKRSSRIIGRHGDFTFGQTYAPRIIRISGYVEGASHATLMLNVDNIKNLFSMDDQILATGEESISDGVKYGKLVFGDETDRYYRAIYNGINVLTEISQRWFLNDLKRIQIELRCDDPFAYATSLSEATMAGDANEFKVFDLGTANNEVIIELSGSATNPVIVEGDKVGVAHFDYDDDLTDVEVSTVAGNFTAAFGFRTRKSLTSQQSKAIQLASKDNLYYDRGNNINGQNYVNFNPHQGTIIFWAKPYFDGDDGIQHLIFKLRVTGNNQISLEKLTGNTLRFTVNLGGAGNNAEIAVNSSNFGAGGWVMVVGRWDRNNTIDSSSNFTQIDLDASENGNTGGHGTPSAVDDTISIGQNFTNDASNVFDGLLHWQVFERALTDSEISDLRNSGAGVEPFVTPDTKLLSAGELSSGDPQSVQYPWVDNKFPFGNQETNPTDEWADEGAAGSGANTKVTNEATIVKYDLQSAQLDWTGAASGEYTFMSTGTLANNQDYFYRLWLNVTSIADLDKIFFDIVGSSTVHTRLLFEGDLVTGDNSDFDTDTGDWLDFSGGVFNGVVGDWNGGGGTGIGKFTLDVAGNSAVFLANKTTVGRKYNISAKLKLLSGSSIALKLGDSTGGTGFISVTPDGTETVFSGEFIATTTSLLVGVEASSGSQVFLMDDVTLTDITDDDLASGNATNKWLYFEGTFEADGSIAHQFRIRKLNANGNATIYIDQMDVQVSLVDKGDFSGSYTGGLNDAWTKKGSGTPTQETTLVHSGADAQKFVTSAVDSGIEQAITFSANKWYMFPVWVRGGDATDDIIIAVTGLSDAVGNLSEQFDNIGTTYVKKSILFKTGSDTSGTIEIYSPNNGDTIYIDDCTVIELDTVTANAASEPTPEIDSYSEEKFNQGLRIDGADTLSWAVKGNPNEGSIECWLKPQFAADWDDDTDDPYIYELLGGSDDFLRLQYDQGGDQWIFRKRAVASTRTASSDVQTFNRGNRIHIIGTWGSNLGVQIYVDGVAGTLNSNTDALNVNPSILHMGAVTTVTSFPDSIIDELYVYSRELSQQEVTAKFNAFKATKNDNAKIAMTKVLATNDKLRIDTENEVIEFLDSSAGTFANAIASMDAGSVFFKMNQNKSVIYNKVALTNTSVVNKIKLNYLKRFL